MKLARSRARVRASYRTTRPRESRPPFSLPASEFSYEEMVKCLDSRGKGVVFFLLVIFSSLGYSCIFENDPISDQYITKINVLEDHLPPDYQVNQPKMILDGTKDQNCVRLLMVFLNHYSVANIGRRKKSSLETMIMELKNETNFIEECDFKTPSKCPNNKVNISIVLENLKMDLKALKPNIENNFTDCFPVRCEAVEQPSTLKTFTTNNGQQASRQEHTTPTVKLKDGSSDQISGDHTQQSNGKRVRYPLMMAFVVILLPLFLVNI